MTIELFTNKFPHLDCPGKQDASEQFGRGTSETRVAFEKALHKARRGGGDLLCWLQQRKLRAMLRSYYPSPSSALRWALRRALKAALPRFFISRRRCARFGLDLCDVFGSLDDGA